MAVHINSLATCGIATVSKDDFYRKWLQPGDLIFACGQSCFDKLLDAETGSLLTHVLTAWLPNPYGPWLTLEATLTRGVHVGLLSDYTDNQDGSLILVRRLGLPQDTNPKILNAMLQLLDDGYNWQTEVTFAAHKLLRALPVAKPRDDLYCSALVWHGAAEFEPFAYQVNAENPIAPTPEELYVDPSAIALCLLEDVHASQ